jgi:pantetheine-phosphate adenylyltransferase
MMPMATQRTALFPGTFDPVTNGHLDVISRATRLFDRIVVAIGTNTAKRPAFDTEERLSQLRRVCKDMPNVEIGSFGGLLTEAVDELKAVAVIRGLRAVSDFEYEFQMALMNRELSPTCETLFLMPRPEFLFVSSTMIREIARLGGDITPFIPAAIREEVQERFRAAPGA